MTFMKHFANNEGILRACYKLAANLCALDPLCLTTTLRDLITTHFGTPEASSSQMEVQEPVKQKSETFYAFALRVCEASISSSEKSVINSGLDLGNNIFEVHLLLI